MGRAYNNGINQAQYRVIIHDEPPIVAAPARPTPIQFIATHKLFAWGTIIPVVSGQKKEL